MYVFNFVIFYDEFFFENFDCVKFFRLFGFGKYDFFEVIFIKYCEEIEVVEVNVLVSIRVGS